MEKKIFGKGYCFWKFYFSNRLTLAIATGQIHLEHASEETNQAREQPNHHGQCPRILHLKKKFYIEQWEYNFRSSFCCQLVIYHKKHCRLVDICHLSFLRELIKHLLDLIMHSLVRCAQKHIWEFTCHFEKTQTLPYVDGVYTYIKHSAIHMLTWGFCTLRTLECPFHVRLGA